MLFVIFINVMLNIEECLIQHNRTEDRLFCDNQSVSKTNYVKTFNNSFNIYIVPMNVY